MQVQKHAPSGQAVAVAILYVIAGAVGFLPGLMILLLLATGIPFWYFVLRVAATPVSFEMFTQGLRTSLLETWPEFPFGLSGMAVLAIHCLAAIPAAPLGLAVLRGTPGAERALRGLGLFYLFVIPLGTVMGLAALAAMGRSTLAPAASREPLASPGDRATAAICYALPVLTALYVFMRGQSSTFVRMHAIQSSALGLAFFALAKATEALQAMTALPILPLVAIGEILVLAVLGFLAYSGSGFKLPWIGTLAERTQAGFAKGQEELEARGALRMHRRNLAAAASVAPRSIATVIEGTPVANGFEQHTGKAPDRALLFVAGGFTVMLLLFLAGAWANFQSGDRSRGGPVVMIAGTLVFGGAIAFSIYVLVRKVLSGAAAEGWLLVRTWPLKPGADVRMQYKAISRLDGKVESVDVVLKCLETIGWRDAKGTSRSTGLCIRDVVVPPLRAHTSADGSVTVEWTLRVPRDGPPSFAGQGGVIHWMLSVDMRLAGAPDSSHAFSMLVIPEMAS